MDTEALTQTRLFAGIQKEDMDAVLSCMNACEKSYKKDEIIMHAGDTTQELGLVLSGSVNITVNYQWGASSIIGRAGRGMIFSENYAAIPDRELLCDVIAAENSTILFLNMDKLLTVCGTGCAFHNQVIHNLIRISAEKSLELSTRMMHTAPKTIRARVISYLSEQAMRSGHCKLDIPFSRQQLADYLDVDRSALSAELSSMQKDGLLRYHKNHFEMLPD